MPSALGSLTVKLDIDRIELLLGTTFKYSFGTFGAQIGKRGAFSVAGMMQEDGGGKGPFLISFLPRSYNKTGRAWHQVGYLVMGDVYVVGLLSSDSRSPVISLQRTHAAVLGNAER